MKRGYFGIGVFHSKNADNIGTLWRSASVFGADFIFTIGKRYSRQCTDTAKTPRHIPLYHYQDWADFYTHIPYDCPVVGVELDDRSIPLERYSHRERCIYLLGAEDKGIPLDIRSECSEIIQITGDHCLNVSVAGSIVMYDRAAKGVR